MFLLGCSWVVLAATTPATVPDAVDPLSAALRVSGIALIAIFAVMGLFGALISIIGRLFPEAEES